MARSRELKVIIAGDADKLNRELKKSGTQLDKLGRQTRLTSTVTSKGFAAMRVGATGAAAAMGGFALAGKITIGAASDVNESLTKNAALFGKYSKGIEQFAKTTADSLGISRREALAATGTFGGLFSSLQIGQRPAAEMSTRLVKLAADLASFNNASPEEALTALRSGLAGEAEPMRRFNAFLSEGRVKSEAYKSGIAAVGAELTEQQKVQARYNLILKDTQKAQGDFGRTSGGLANQQRILRANFDDAKVALGDRLLPTVTKGIKGVNRFVDEMQSGTGTGGKFVDTLDDISDTARPIVSWIGRATVAVGKFTGKHPEVGKLAAAVIGVGVAVKTLRFVSAATGFTTLLKAGRTVMRKMVGVFATQGAAAGAAAGTAAAGSQGLTGAARFNKIRSAGRRLGVILGRGMTVGVVLAIPLLAVALERALRTKISEPIARWGKSIIDKVNPFGDGFGIGKIAPGKGSASLQGANAALAPVAAVGRRFGLGVSSGLRPGATTSSGRPSYHGTGEAIDLVGPPAGMMRTFRTLKSKMGSRLAELIYTPGGVGVRHGRPHRYTGQVAADHFDHVHVALDLGRRGPGIGDGPGRSREDEMNWLKGAWRKVAPLWGLSAKSTPFSGLFRHIRLGDNPFVGVATDAGGAAGKNPELLWPNWLWRGGKGNKRLTGKTKLQLFIHEMAHRFQSPSATPSAWEAEGGAEAFARIAMGRLFGGAVRHPQDPYKGDVTRVVKQRGWGWITKGQFAGKSGGRAGKGPISGQRVAELARRAGFKGSALVTALAVAKGESGWNTTAINRSNRDGSVDRGLWQINSVHGRLSTLDPLGNARAAYRISKGGRDWSPWVVFNRGLHRPHIEAARRAALASRGGGGGGGRSRSSRGSAGRVNPYELASAQADLAVAQAEGAGTITVGGRRVGTALQQIQANIGKRDVVSARIRKIRRLLRKRLPAATRLRLTTELAGLLGEHRQLGETIAELRAPPEPGEAVGGDVGGGEDPNQALIDAINAKAEQDREIAEEQARQAEELQRLEEERIALMAELNSQLKLQNSIAQSTVGIGLREAQRALADMISGQLGYKTGGRVALAGSGTLARY